MWLLIHINKILVLYQLTWMVLTISCGRQLEISVSTSHELTKKDSVPWRIYIRIRASIWCTVKPVYNNHLMGYFSAFWSSSRWPRATYMTSRWQKLLATVNWYLQSSFRHITDIIEAVVTDRFHCMALTRLYFKRWDDKSQVDSWWLRGRILDRRRCKENLDSHEWTQKQVCPKFSCLIY